MKSNRLFASVLILGLAHLASAQTIQILWPQRKAPFPLPVPAGLDTNFQAADTAKNPYLTVYQATVNPNGAALVICPGGGYEHLSPIREGRNVALKFNGYGISGFVLRYRFGTTTGGGSRHPIEMWDAQRAVRWVRANAARFGVDPKRVGIMGFSAGGHLGSTVATRYDAGNPDSATSIDWFPGAKDSVDRFSCRPDFQILGYPVINMDNTAIAHAGSVLALLGTNPSAALKTLLSNEKQVTSLTPPAFIFAARNDVSVPIQNSRLFSDSLRKKGVVGDTLFVATGGHGFGLADGQDGAVNDATAKVWPDSARAWMQRMGFLSTTALFQSRSHSLFITPFSKTGNGDGLDLLGRQSNQPHGWILKILPNVK